MKTKYFIIFLMFTTLIYPQSKTQKVKTNISNKEIIEKIEESIYNLKYSQDFFKKRDALNYIFDNIDKAKSIIEDTLEEEDDDILIANLVQLIDISEKNFTPELIDKLIKRCKNKPSFVYNILKYFNNRKDYERIDTIFNNVFKEKNNLEAKYSVLMFIKENNFQKYKELLIDYLLKTKSFFLSQEIINTLAALKIENQELIKMIQFLGSIDEGVRNSAVNLFGQYPELAAVLIKEFDNSNDFFFKDSIIKTLAYYDSNEEVLSFFLDNLEDNLYQKSIIMGLISFKIDKAEIINKLIDFYNNSDITVKSIIMNVFSLKYNNSSDDTKYIIFNFIKHELTKAYNNKDVHSLYFILKSILNISYNDSDVDKIIFLLKENPLSWIIEKTVIQILDLKR
ncbi:MAG TPA: hypothetical protein PK663_08625 [Spirochaetota bacterium]|nr:hypothetical protein [Spirochaetota bacterium]HPQ49998.1 hypothetical protein [Spirochaetota bacterium]